MPFSPEQTGHLATGDLLPPLAKGQVRLYSNRFCPFAHRARLVLAAKEVPFHIVNIDLKKKPEWYFTKNPLGSTPCYESDDKIVTDSAIICEFLNDSHNNPLWPQDPYQKALDKMVLEYFSSKVSPAFFKSSYYPVKGEEEKWFGEYLTHLAVIEDKLKERGTPFFGGAKPGMLDYLIWPWFERQVVYGAKLPFENFPTLAAFREAMKQDPAVQQAAVPDSLYVKQFNNYINGIYDYDIQ
ncbi:glutathione S-transferase omega-1-like [Patiria miniata]|uniref:Glutathione S-transferase omega n=1 Tax=Patiria miniata TaxID=46514 RepID=A0A914B4E4_PATMI|nr:glutathione S-transferase omega-1-like [Patiria miniata]